MSIKKVDEMYAFYQQGKTLVEVAQQFGMTKQGVSRAFLREGLATRSGYQSQPKGSAVKCIDDSYLIEYKKNWNTLDSRVKGGVAESEVKNTFACLGYDVWQPAMNNHKADLGVFIGGRLLRLQVKTATYDLSSKRYRANLQTRDKNGNHIPYEQEYIDFFVVFCPGVDDLYIIPAAVGIKNHTVNVMPHRERLSLTAAYEWEQYRNAFSLVGGHS